MKNFSIVVLSLVAVFGGWGATAQAGTLDFTFTAPGGAISEDIPILFPLIMDPFPGVIDTLILEIEGLTHPDPMDLDIYLIDPFGTVALDVITDRGGQFDISGLNLVISDLALQDLSVTDSAPGFVTDEEYQPDDPRGLAAFSGVAGGLPSGNLPWTLLVIDDTVDGSGGSFTSFTLRGTVVPEPATMSLLALGAIALFRRSRKSL